MLGHTHLYWWGVKRDLKDLKCFEALCTSRRRSEQICIYHQWQNRRALLNLSDYSCSTIFWQQQEILKHFDIKSSFPRGLAVITLWKMQTSGELADKMRISKWWSLVTQWLLRQTIFVMMGPEASIIMHSKCNFVSNNSNIFTHQLD